MERVRDCILRAIGSPQRQKAIVFAFFLCVLIYPSCGFAKDIKFEVTLDRDRTGLGQPTELGLTFEGTQDMPVMDLPALEGFQSRYLGPSTRMSIINGRASSSLTHVYTLLPTKAGTFKIGPFKFEHKGDTYYSNAVSVEVAEAAVNPQDRLSKKEQPGSEDLKDRIFLSMYLKKDKVYLNEIFPVTVKLFVNRLGVRDIQYPQFNQDGFSAGEFGRPRQYQEVVNGVNYDVVEFQTEAFGLKPGEFRIGPAVLQCNLVVQKQNRRKASPSFEDFFNSDMFGDLFGGYQAYPLSIKSEDVFLTVLPLPEEDKPLGFSGASGVFDLEVAVNPSEVKVGDPITIKRSISGQGNFNTVDLSRLEVGDGFKVYEAQVKQEKNLKTFEQVLIPLTADIKEIPAVNFSFFNTQAGRYETVIRGPFPVKVTAPEKAEEQKIVEGKHAVFSLQEEKLGRDIIYIKDDPGRLMKRGGGLYKNKLFLGLQIMPALFYFLILAIHSRKKRLKTDVRFARQLLAPGKARKGMRRAKGLLEKGSVSEFYDVLFETLQEYLGDKFHLPSKGITMSILDEHLKNKGLREEVLLDLKDIFSECDMVRYASSQLTRENMLASLKKLEEAIDHLQRNKV